MYCTLCLYCLLNNFQPFINIFHLSEYFTYINQNKNHMSMGVQIHVTEDLLYTRNYFPPPRRAYIYMPAITSHHHGGHIYICPQLLPTTTEGIYIYIPSITSHHHGGHIYIYPQLLPATAEGIYIYVHNEMH